jgi:Protein of unknown function (DUF2510)
VCHPRPIDVVTPVKWAPTQFPEAVPEPVIDLTGSDEPLTSTEPARTEIGIAGAGWHPDPREPGRRLRWWDGTTWTVRVVTLEADSEGISWHASMADLAPPAAQATIPGLATATADVGAAPPSDAAPAPDAAPAHDATDAEVVPLPRTRPRRWAIPVAAALLVALAAGAGAAILPVGDQTPTVEPTQTYRDPAAGFALRYPDHWRKAETTPGEGIRFDVGATDAPASRSDTVTVAADTVAAPFPALHELANLVTTRLREDFPEMRLESAEQIQLMHAPAYRLRLVDETSSRTITVEQIVGQATDGRLVKITMTIREPRNAPTERELKEFLASISGISEH